MSSDLFLRGNKATKWQMLNMRKVLRKNQRANYIKSFLGVKEYVETRLTDKIWDVNLTIHVNSPATTLKHKGRLNAPTVDKIAISLPSSDVITKKHKRYVTVNYRQKPGTNQLEFIPDYHRSYDPLQYPPLIFPDGQDRWHCDLEHACLQHVNSQIMERVKQGEPADGIKVVNPILRGQSLGQQYMVDQFAKTELSRLNYIECHQKELRAEVYLGAKDTMKSDGLGKLEKRWCSHHLLLVATGTCINSISTQ